MLAKDDTTYAVSNDDDEYNEDDDNVKEEKNRIMTAHMNKENRKSHHNDENEEEERDSSTESGSRGPFANENVSFNDDNSPQKPTGIKRTLSGTGSNTSGGSQSRHKSRTRQETDELAFKLQQFAHDIQGIQENCELDREEHALLLNKLRKTQESIHKLSQDIPSSLEKCSESIDNICKKLQEHTPAQEEEQDKKYHLFFEKQFRLRESLLTEMLDSTPNYKTLYNIAVAVMVWLGVNMMMDEYLKTGNVLDVGFLFWGFSGSDFVLKVWLAMFTASFMVVPLVQAIVSFDIPVLIWGPFYACYQLALMILPTVVTFQAQLPPPSAMILMCEQTRMIMKVHSYLREKMLYGSGKFDEYAKFVPEWAAQRGVTLEEHVRPPHITIEDASKEIGRYLYFHFAPTLIYRDNYPRKGVNVDWIRAIKHFLNLFGVVIYTFLLFKTFCIPEFHKSASNPGDVASFFKSVFRSMIPGTFLLMLSFFGLLHSWFNAWAELLCFGDRRFYEDWWNVKNWAAYYRKWNAVVHDWLRTYLYFDVIRFSKGNAKKGIAMASVFVVSAIVHEHIIAGSLGFFYPVMLLMFGGPGVFFIKLTQHNHPIYNVFMWAMLSCGTALLMVLYTSEYYARFGPSNVTHQAVEATYGFLGSMIPRSWIIAFGSK